MTYASNPGCLCRSSKKVKITPLDSVSLTQDCVGVGDRWIRAGGEEGGTRGHGNYLKHGLKAAFPFRRLSEL